MNEKELTHWAKSWLPFGAFLWSLVAAWLIVEFRLVPRMTLVEMIVPLSIPIVTTAAAAFAAMRDWKTTLVVCTALTVVVFILTFSVALVYAPGVAALVWGTIAALTDEA